MQRLFDIRLVENEERKNSILEIISDKYCRDILKITTEKPKSAIEISTEGKIPISTVYRRLQNLHDNNLIRISGSISKDGKKYFLYKSKIKSFSVTFDCNNLEISIIPNNAGNSFLEEPC